MTQRFHILPEYKILVIHIDSKVFNSLVKKYFENLFWVKQKKTGTFMYLFTTQ
jgi:hypothetical protein